MRTAGILLVICGAFCMKPIAAPAEESGTIPVLIRGETIVLHHYTAVHSVITHPNAVLFPPGDGGWRGFAVDIAESLAARGYEVFGVDTHAYLEIFTGKSHLTPIDVANDYRDMAQYIRSSVFRPVTFLGWSEDAGLSLLAASLAHANPSCSGLITLGLGTINILAWRQRDDTTWITIKNPKGPSFSARDYLPIRYFLPFFMIHSSGNEFTPVEEARSLFSLAGRDTQLRIIRAGNHRFSGNTSELFRTLDEGLAWTVSAHR